MERPAIGCFREVLRACPLALEAAQSLMQLGVKGMEIQEVTLETTSGRMIPLACDHKTL
jgi:anaphase-promoting complex subunit 7